MKQAGGRFQFRVPLSGMTCLSTSHLRHHSQFSDNDSRPGCQLVGSDLTLLRWKLCGWDPIDNLARSPSVSFLCSQQSSGSLSLPVTLALSWTVSCQCRNMYLHFADLVSTTYDNSDQWPDRWHQQLPRQWSRHYYRVALITVTCYYMASARTWCDASSQFKMPPHVFSLEPDAEITSR